MIQSMTGYGKHIIQLPTKKITVEVKSLNSKNLDLNTRIPSSYREKELQIRNLLAKSLSRGKVDFNLYIEMTGEATNTQVNAAVVKEYIAQLRAVVNGDETELLEINTYRSDEGSVLKKDFLERIDSIEALLKEVAEIDDERIQNVRERLHTAVSDLKERVDENRFEQELIYYLEKYDITEEKVRLQNHLDYFREAIASNDSNGKKLGFITQEIGREINTIGSKSNFAPMQQLVVQMKDELEKIKEQALNVL